MIKKDGPPPKPASKRRRANAPASYGLAEPVKVGEAGKQPRLGFKCHPMVRDTWASLKGSVESMFFSDADWQRARAELWFMNQVLTGEIPLTAPNWQRIQAGLSELLVSPADKRRAGIELKAATADPDAVAAVEILAGYQSKLAG